MKDRAPRPAERSPLGAKVGQPDLEQVAIGLGVLRLHAGDHAELGKPWDVEWRWRLVVLVPVAEVACRGGESVQRLPYRRVADGVDLDLPATRVGRMHRFGKLIRLPQRLAAACC